MSGIWTILKREYIERVRQRSFLIGTVLVPLFMLSVIFIPTWLAVRTTGRPVRLVVLDATASLQGKLDEAIRDTLPDGSRRFRLSWERVPAGGDSKTILRAYQNQVLEGLYTGLLWIPPDALKGGTAELYAQNAADSEIETSIRHALTRAAMTQRLVAHGIDDRETDAISKDVPFKVFKLSKEGVREGGFESDFLRMLTFAMILYMTILLYGVQVQRSILEEKNSRIVEVLLSSARPFQLMLGKVIGIGGVGLTQYAIWSLVALVGSAYIKSSNPMLANTAAIPPVTFVFFVVYFLLGYFLYSAVYAAIGSMATTEQEAQQLQWPVTILIMIPVILMGAVIRDPDGPLSTVISLIPFFSPIMMVMRIHLHTPPGWQIAMSMILMAAAVVAVAAIAGRIFRVGILMYGKRPTLPELLRWIRQS